MTVDHAEGAKFVVPFFPSRTMGLPHESNIVQCIFAVVGQGGVFAVTLELVLVSLALNPLGKGGVALPIMWNVARSVLLSVVE